MLKFSLVVLFAMSMAMLTIGASHLPAPPTIGEGMSHVAVPGMAGL